MKKFALLSLAAALAFSACTKSSSSNTTPAADSTFNGGYFQIAYNNQNFNVKDVTVNSIHYNKLLSNNTTVTGTKNYIVIQVAAPGIYGLSNFDIYLLGTGDTTGTFTFSSPSSWAAYTSDITQTTPSITFSDTSGTATITHNGSDYLQGTFTTTLYNGSLSYPATGSFKIVH